MTVTLTGQTTQMLSPVPPTRNTDATVAPRLGNVDTARIGLLHNGKPGGEHILDGIAGVLQAEHPGVSLPRRFKAHASDGAGFLPELAGDWDAAVIAVGDCGSCSSWAIRDGVDLEKLGIPTIVFVSAPFGTMSRMWATRLGVPELGIVVVDHPLAHLPSTEIAETMGAANALRVRAMLTGER